MNTPLLWLLLWLAPTQAPNELGRITGVAVNGTHGQTPLASAVVVLRANFDGGFIPIEETRTDADGRFTFNALPLDEEVIYLPGVNHQDVNYPGPRLKLTDDRPEALVRIVAYDAIASPSPLFCRRAQLDVRPGEGFLEITETLTIANPANVAFAGESRDGRPPITLRVSLPSGFDAITFDKEFNDRNFLLHDNQLLSDLPWSPGEREMRFRYRLPARHGGSALQRDLDLPTDQVIVRVWDKAADQIACSLAPLPQQQDGPLVFEHSGRPLPAGHAIELQIGGLPITIDAYARWGAVALLSVLTAVAAVVVRRRRRAPAVHLEDPDDTGVTLRNMSPRTGVVPFEGVTPRNMPSPAERRRRAA